MPRKFVVFFKKKFICCMTLRITLCKSVAEIFVFAGVLVSSILAFIFGFDDDCCLQTFTVHNPYINIQTLCEYIFLTYLIYLKQVLNGGKKCDQLCNGRITSQVQVWTPSSAINFFEHGSFSSLLITGWSQDNVYKAPMTFEIK